MISRSACALLSLAVGLAGLACTLSPGNGRVLGSRAEVFDVVVAYPADNPNLGRNAVISDISALTVRAMPPFSDRTPGRCAELGPQCPWVDELRKTYVFLRRSTGGEPLVRELLSPGLRPRGWLQESQPFMVGGISAASLMTDVTGEDLVLVTVKDVQMPEARWGACADAPIPCPPGVRFFARLQTVITYGETPLEPLTPGSFNTSLQTRALPRAVGVPFQEGDATRACVMQRFRTEGAAAVRENCSLSGQDFTLIFARS